MFGYFSSLSTVTVSRTDYDIEVPWLVFVTMYSDCKCTMSYSAVHLCL